MPFRTHHHAITSVRPPDMSYSVSFNDKNDRKKSTQVRTTTSRATTSTGTLLETLLDLRWTFAVETPPATPACNASFLVERSMFCFILLAFCLAIHDILVHTFSMTTCWVKVKRSYFISLGPSFSCSCYTVPLWTPSAFVLGLGFASEAVPDHERS
jgi:hypothetical protein